MSMMRLLSGIISSLGLAHSFSPEEEEKKVKKTSKSEFSKIKGKIYKKEKKGE